MKRVSHSTFSTSVNPVDREIIVSTDNCRAPITFVMQDKGENIVNLSAHSEGRFDYSWGDIQSKNIFEQLVNFTRFSSDETVAASTPDEIFWVLMEFAYTGRELMNYDDAVRSRLMGQKEIICPEGKLTMIGDDIVFADKNGNHLCSIVCPCDSDNLYKILDAIRDILYTEEDESTDGSENLQ